MHLTARPRELDYLVGGLRISVVEGSTTPGPRSHILGALEGLRHQQVHPRLFVASEQLLLGRFASLPEGSGSGGARQRLAGDAIRLLACAWSLLLVRWWSRASRADIVYERAAVYQCLGMAHRRRRAALYVVESNGIFSRETARDRQALASPRLAAALERQLYRRADLVVVVSERLKVEVREFAGVRDSKIVVVPNAVPDVAFTIDRRAGACTPTIGFAGTLVPWQRVDLLLQAAAQVPDVRVEVIGDGPQLAPLRALADHLGIADRVAFCGRVPHAEALQRMAGWSAGYAGHVASSSASMYHSPLKVYEYAGLGLELIATRTSDLEELEREGVRVFYISDEGSVIRAVKEFAHGCRDDADEVAAVRRRLQGRHSWSARMAELLGQLPARAA